MDIPTTEQTQSACTLLTEAKQESVVSGDVVRLVLGGTRRIDSWLIEHRIVPRLQQQNATTLHFMLMRGKEKRCAALLPLRDGSAFARSTQERWSALERLEALSAIQYIGYRYAPDNRWTDDFSVLAQTGEEPPRPVAPFEVAKLWTEATGLTPSGFEAGTVDAMEALGLKLIGRIFNSQGRLGL